nr:hypothetical protein [Tanacetum cinerariifolium]
MEQRPMSDSSRIITKSLHQKRLLDAYHLLQTDHSVQEPAWMDTNGINSLKLLLISCFSHSFWCLFLSSSRFLYIIGSCKRRYKAMNVYC